MRIGSIGIKTFVFNLIYYIRTIGENLLLYVVKFVAYYYRFEFYAETVGKYTASEEILDLKDGKVTVKRRLESGVETVVAPLPCVVTVNGSAIIVKIFRRLADCMVCY